MKYLRWSSLIAALAVGCSQSKSPADAAIDLMPPPVTMPGESDASAALVAARPYNFHVPTGYNPAKPTPLLIMLHGYQSSGMGHEAYFHFTPVADAHGFLYAYPDGTLDSLKFRFWNATDGCCNLFMKAVDDVGYLNALIDDVSAKYNVDPKRIYVVGHSNGGFMSHRTACDLSPRVAAIVSLAGAQWNDASKCQPTQKVSVLEIHGDADMTISYDAGYAGGYMGLAMHPSAHETVADWANKNGCTGALAATGTIDLVPSLSGAETRQESYAGCPAGTDVELWTIANGPHMPDLSPMFAEIVYGFLSAHSKP